MNIFKKIANLFKKTISNKVEQIKSLGFKFGNTTELAIMQDSLIAQYKRGDKTITPAQMSDLKNNPWVKLATKLAPNNLVVRQLCLIDLFSNKKDNVAALYNLLDTLSRGKKIWAEGYSYWLYTREALDLWVNAFNDPDILDIINTVDMNFYLSSYLRDKKWYPAPFGDLRDIPLSEALQIDHGMDPCTVSNVLRRFKDKNVVYEIIGKPIGLNTHIPKDNYSVAVSEEGIPQGFKFYRGYDKKYSSVAEEMADTFDPKRIASV